MFHEAVCILLFSEDEMAPKYVPYNIWTDTYVRTRIGRTVRYSIMYKRLRLWSFLFHITQKYYRNFHILLSCELFLNIMMVHLNLLFLQHPVWWTISTKINHKTSSIAKKGDAKILTQSQHFPFGHTMLNLEWNYKYGNIIYVAYKLGHSRRIIYFPHVHNLWKIYIDYWLFL